MLNKAQCTVEGISYVQYSHGRVVNLLRFVTGNEQVGFCAVDGFFDFTANGKGNLGDKHG